eukprot:11852385-Alexandrium_andersonii.AAC.1
MRLRREELLMGRQRWQGRGRRGPGRAPAPVPAAPVAAPCRAGAVLLPCPLVPALPAPVARW